MGRSALKAEALEDEYLIDKCIDRNQGPETDISPDCLQAAMEAMFLDRYNVTVTYNEQVGIQGHEQSSTVTLLISLLYCVWNLCEDLTQIIMASLEIATVSSQHVM